MILLDSWNPVYRVRFEADKSLNEEFEYKEDALEYAKFHLDSKPIVEGVEVYIDDMGTITEEAEAEEIYSYLTEAKKEEEPEVKLDRLAELEAELEKADDEEEPAEGAIPEEPAEISSEVATAVEEPVPAEEPDEDFDPYGFVPGTEIEEPQFVDPFATDFSDISEDEAEAAAMIDHSITPVDFLNDLAKQLGIEDEVVITSATDEYPDAEPVETCSDAYGAFNCFDVEEPKTEVVVTAEVPADAIDQISSENATVKVDADGIEAPAETVSTCTVCPECGKEICECNKQESLEATVDQDLSDVRQPEEVKKPEILEKPVDYKAEVAEEKGLKEFYDHEDHTIESEQELKGTDNAVVKCKVADVVAHCEDEKPVDCKGEKKPLEKPLTEDVLDEGPMDWIKDKFTGGKHSIKKEYDGTGEGKGYKIVIATEQGWKKEPEKFNGKTVIDTFDKAEEIAKRLSTLNSKGVIKVAILVAKDNKTLTTYKDGKEDVNNLKDVNKQNKQDTKDNKTVDELGWGKDKPATPDTPDLSTETSSEAETKADDAAAEVKPEENPVEEPKAEEPKNAAAVKATKEFNKILNALKAAGYDTSELLDGKKVTPKFKELRKALFAESLTEDVEEDAEVTEEATTVGELADEIATAADPETPVEFKPVETADGELEVKALEIEQEDDKVVISVQTEEPTEVQAEEEPLEDDMTDQELAEKLWEAHCEKQKAKEENK